MSSPWRPHATGSMPEHGAPASFMVSPLRLPCRAKTLTNHPPNPLENLAKATIYHRHHHAEPHQPRLAETLTGEMGGRGRACGREGQGDGVSGAASLRLACASSASHRVALSRGERKGWGLWLGSPHGCSVLGRWSPRPEGFTSGGQPDLKIYPIALDLVRRLGPILPCFARVARRS